jgi:hypothetical protein
VRRSLAAGDEIRLTAEDLRLAPVFGSVRVRVTPAGARVTYRRGNGAATEAPSGEMELEPGRYDFRASADGYQSAEQTVTIAAGETHPVEIALVAIRRQAHAPPKDPMAIWATPGRWTKDDRGYVLKGKSVELASPAPATGRFEFTVPVAGGIRNLLGTSRGDVAWVSGYHDDLNHTRIYVTRNDVEWVQIEAGAKVRKEKLPHGVRVRKDLHVVFEIAANNVIVKVRSGDVVKTVENPMPVQPGKFGILPLKPETTILSFRH